MPKRSSPKRDFMEVARGIVEQAIAEQMDGKPLPTHLPESRTSQVEVVYKGTGTFFPLTGIL